MTININTIGTIGNSALKATGSSTLGNKVVGAAGGALAGLSVLGSYNAYKDIWTKEAAEAQRNAMLDSSMYERKVGFTGNSFIDPIFQAIADPNFLFSDIIRKVYFNVKGFGRDVILNNVIPIALGGTAAIWGFNKSLVTALGGVGHSLVTTGKIGRKGYIAIRKATKDIMPKVDIKPMVRFFTPKSPKGILSLALLGLLGGIYLPIRMLDAGTGGYARRTGEDFLNYKQW